MSMFFGNSILGRVRILMDKAGGDGGGGGGGGGGNNPPPAPDSAKELADLKASNAALLARLDALEAKGGGGTPPPPKKDDDDLGEKARKEREAKEKQQGETKKLEGALKFTLGAAQWLKDNASLLPKSIEGIFTQADKENYGNAVEKADAIKVGIVAEFFAQQANLDLLTATQKEALDDWKNLTKTEKQARVQQIFDNVFEPTFEALRRVKKAEALSKGLGESSGAEDAYKKKMQEISKKHYLGVK